ncbi:DUF1433 domain-containing protein [Listeria booriae]|uniref:DUF1433 domain-containing protein n=1 Tax=Listeria booriae TaxID=1552123 RepID=A0A841VY03_9LIST|nr:DUF1433 domain-containing protein [Listeria booriae]MBC1318513.1 DUF1433 domain-containing protein [Listeria booriae]MBC1618019.1 DUF1433 domain-containing protein [Listeria booriae]MBC2388822.1 DUF1433 domain-containing protein [Listeria booriae]
MKKWILYTSIILLLLIIITGGWLFVNHQQKEKAIDTIAKEEQPRIEKYIRYNYNDIESVHFTDITINPTGIPHVEGYVNNDKDAWFDAGIYDKHFEVALSQSGKLLMMLKPEFEAEGAAKSVSEIEAEEKNK